MRRWAGLVLAVVLAAAAVFGMAAAYLFYQDTLQTAQEKNLTAMAQTASSNLTGYFDRLMDELDIQFSEASVARAVAARDNDVEGALDDLMETFPGVDEAVVGLAVERVDEVPVSGVPDKTTVLEWGLDEGVGGYVLVLARPLIYRGALLGYVTEAVDLNAVYGEVLSSIQVGERGYCTVKDPSMTIVMHRLPSQLGVNTKSDRAQGHPEGDWEDLFATQYEGRPGCRIVTSYWWDDVDAGLAKKFIAYAPAYIDGRYFVVNVVMAYDELMEPLRRMLFLCTALGAVVIAAFALGGWQLAKSVQNARHLRRELAYEKELHSQTQRIKLQERQIQHIDRLQTMGIVTSSLAHELKNLMTPLSIYGQMLKDDGLSPEERREVADEIDRITLRCTDMVGRMLAYVRHRLPSEGVQPFDASEAVEDALVMVRALCPRGVRLEASGDGAPHVVAGDPAAIAQILLNLATNALYAMRDGGGVLSVRWGVDDARAHVFCLRVADTGCGMDEHTRQKLFTSFFTTKGEEGTGLGMSVVQGLVQSMRGSIEVESGPGAGTAFTLRFPLYEAEPGAEPSEP